MTHPKKKSLGARLDAAGLTLLAAGLAVAACVVAEPVAPEIVYEPGRGVVSPGGNALGPLAAGVAGPLTDALGVAVYVLLAGWWALAALLLLRRAWLTWLRRLAGILLLVPAAAVLAERAGPDRLAGPPVGPGGSVGWAGQIWLTDAIGPVGATGVLAGALGISGLLIVGFGWMRRLAVPARWPRRPRRPRPPRPTPPRKPPRPEPRPEVDEEEVIPITHAAGPDAEGPAEERPFELPPLELLDEPEPTPHGERDEELRRTAAQLEKTYRDFSLNVRVVGIHTGPVITVYELTLETGLRVAKVTALADDVALNLGVPSVRIVAPIPGKSTVGVEVPNDRRAVVRMRESLTVAAAAVAKAKLPICVGKDVEGRSLIYDLAEMPHLLIAGRTGTGKSVCMNSVILSLLMTRPPEQARMIMIDPKMLELSEYARIPHLMHPVVKDMKKAEALLAWAVDKMEERYEILSRARVRGIAGYNALSYAEILKRVKPADDEERERVPETMPYIVIFVDEMGDLMMLMKKEVEGHIIRLAQKSRAAGIHLVVATQKPTVDVITGLIKSNLPARICFQVSSRTDSAVVLDEKGAERLLGMGDMLFLQPKTSTIVRAQGTYAGDDEIARVVEFLDCDPSYESELMDLRSTNRDGKLGFLESLKGRDEVYEQAIEVVVREGRGSVSLLQRTLGIGYGRAARLIDYMAEDGVVGGYNGSQAREVLYTPEKWQEIKDGTATMGA